MSQNADIDLYSDGTPNGHKISITLEEIGVPYNAHHIDIAKNIQKEEWFLKVNPNGRIPAIVDKTFGKEKRVFEGAAIQLYLCAKHDKDLKISFPYDSDEYWEMVEWMVWLQSGIGPMQGQANHFFRYAPEKIEYGINRYQNETKRLYQVLNDRLAQQQSAGQGLWIVGGKYSAADICCFSWIPPRDVPQPLDHKYAKEHANGSIPKNWAAWAGVETKPFGEIEKWLDAIRNRPAVERGVNVPIKFEMREKMKDSKAADDYAKHHSQWIMKGMKDDAEKHK